MAKRTIILSEDQLNEMIGLGYGDCGEDDFAENGGNEVFTGEHFDDEEYSNPTITDRIASDYNISDIGTLWKNGCGRGLALREMSKADWVKKNSINEANKDFNGRTLIFSDEEKKFLMSCPQDSVAKNAAIKGLPMTQLAPTVSEFETAIEKSKRGDSTTLNNMGGIEAYRLFKKHYEKAKDFSSQKAEAIKRQGSSLKHGGKKPKSDNDNEIITYEN